MKKLPNIFVFSHSGCGACQEYIPKFRRVCKAADVPYTIVDTSTAGGDKIADNYDIDATPTTIMTNSNGTYKIEGDLPEDHIKQLVAMLD